MIDYSFVAAQIPHVMQSLYNEDVYRSTSLTELRDAFRVNQVQGKAWLLSQLTNVSKDARILVVGSWFGFTSYCLYKMGFTYITEVDPDTRLELMAHHINHENLNFKHYSKDVNEIDIAQYDVIVNTSCEHISNNEWFDKIPAGCLVLLQSTNFPADDHTNTVHSLDDMKSKYKLNYTYTDALTFNPRFTRFMLCGEKL